MTARPFIVDRPLRPRRPLTLLLAGLFAFALVAIPTAILPPVDAALIPPVDAALIAGAPVTDCGDPDTDLSIDTRPGTMITCDTMITNTITAIDPATGVARDTGEPAATAAIDAADSMPAGFPWLPLAFVWFVGALVVSARVWRRDRRMWQRGFAGVSPIA